MFQSNEIYIYLSYKTNHIISVHHWILYQRDDGKSFKGKLSKTGKTGAVRKRSFLRLKSTGSI